uniref:Kunitz n=1 Tax=Opheodrys aestivus TaxID=186591 RepID=A0A098LWU7_9SAUR
MSSGSLLLLLGLLSLWAELTPVSGQDRPRFCYLPPETGICKAYVRAFYYNLTSNECQEFVYGGCVGNANRFETEDDCKDSCVEKPGECPLHSPFLPCLRKCVDDWNCAGEKKCCHYGCLSECKDSVYRK